MVRNKKWGYIVETACMLSLMTSCCSESRKKQNQQGPEEVLALLREVRLKSTPAERLKAIEHVMDKSDFLIRYYHLLNPAARYALESGKLDTAEKYAGQLLESARKVKSKMNGWDWNQGNAIHNGHIVLGLVALKRGEMVLAKHHLMESTKTSGSPQLGEYGTDFELARELLKKKKQQTVVEYLKACRSIWKSRTDSLEIATEYAREGAANPREFILRFSVPRKLASEWIKKATDTLHRVYPHLIKKHGKTSSREAPIPEEHAHRVIQIGAVTGIMQHCGLPWMKRFLLFMRREREKAWTKLQVTFIAVQHGVSQGMTAAGMRLLDCDDSVKTAVWDLAKARE